jgi:hypothetical protein
MQNANKQVLVASTIKNATVKPANEVLPTGANATHIYNFLKTYPNASWQPVWANVNENANDIKTLTQGNFFGGTGKNGGLSVNYYHLGLALHQYGLHPVAENTKQGIKLNFNGNSKLTNSMAIVSGVINAKVFVPALNKYFTATNCAGITDAKAGSRTWCTFLPMLNGYKLNNKSGYDSNGKQISNPSTVLIKLHSNPTAINNADIKQIKFFKTFIKQLKG